MWWLEFKTELTDALAISRDALHLLAGIGLQATLVLLFRSWFGAMWPIGIVALVGAGNEWLDLTSDVWTDEARQLQYWESGKDMVLTVAIPLDF